MKRGVFVVVMAVFLSMPVLAHAVGPFDGAYNVTENSTAGQFMDYVVVLQNGNQVAVAILYPDVGSWFYGTGTLTGNTANGLLFHPAGASFGSFSITLGTDGSLSGTLMDSGLTVTLNGSKIF